MALFRVGIYFDWACGQKLFVGGYVGRVRVEEGFALWPVVCSAQSTALTQNFRRATDETRECRLPASSDATRMT